MTEHKEACCTSPAAVCYWFTVSHMAWGVLSFIRIFWRPLHALSLAATLFGMAESKKIAGRCKTGASNHFGKKFDEQKDCRL